MCEKNTGSHPKGVLNRSPCNKENSFNSPPDKFCLGRRVLRDTGKREEFIHIARNWITVPRIATEFCLYFTDMVPTSDETEPLVVKCIRTAVVQWELAESRNCQETECFRAFLQGLFDHVPEANTWCVYQLFDKSELIWDPAKGGLSEWWKALGMPPRLLRRDTHLNRISDPDLRLFIATRILSRPDVSVLLGGLRAISQEMHLVPD